MKIENIRIKNFKAFRKIEILDVPKLAVFVVANGTGKTTIFNVFGFLKDTLTENVHVALIKLGGSKGCPEMKRRGAEDPRIIE